MDIAFGLRLGEIVTATSSLSQPKKVSKTHIPVADIVTDAKYAHAEHLSEVKIEVERSLHSCNLAKVRKMLKISHLLQENKEDVSNRMPNVFKMMECLVGGHQMGVIEKTQGQL